MVYKLYITDSAQADLDSIFDYCSENFSPETAKRTLQGLSQTILQLEVFPEGFINLEKRIGRKLFANGTVRMIPSKSYLIFYLVRNERVDVLRVLHSRTDYLNHLETLFKGNL